MKNSDSFYWGKICKFFTDDDLFTGGMDVDDNGPTDEVCEDSCWDEDFSVDSGEENSFAVFHSHKHSDPSFTGYLGCTECSCSSYIEDKHNVCICGHKFSSHRRPGE